MTSDHGKFIPGPMPKTQATYVSMRSGALLTTLLLAALCAAAAEETVAPEVKCSSDPVSSTGLSMITSGAKVTTFRGPMEDPFAELSEDSDESLLMVDDAPAAPMAAAKMPEAEPSRTEAATPLKAPTTNARKLLQQLLPSGLVCLLVAGLGILMSFLMEAAMHKDVSKPIKKNESLRGSCPSMSAASPTDSIAETTEDEELLSDVPVVTKCNTLKEEEDEYGCTALHYAADRGAPEEVRTLLARGAAVDRREAWDETPLHFAARNGSVEVCELLLAHGAELNPVNESDCTPLLVAAQAGKEAVCKLLLERGAHAGGKPDDQLPPLLSALLVERIFAEAKAAETAVDAAEDE